ncbi:DMT family transporter [Roseomonas fluvialis]|uniref:ABC transporter permease n=1 Tax=Roseomonas fluvialis TaxID=1750527 RepID=A0ABM8I6P7_9PROT|nr:DMT family transporter [Roseomonas fluvialis]BDG74483.1 ABC transporter permease [Roseomonas fluvialis]
MSDTRRILAGEWVLLGLLSLLWGGSFFFAKVALSEVPPLTIVLARVAIAASALWLYLRLRGAAIPSSAAIWWAFCGMGFLNNLLPFSLIFWGQTFIDSGLASIINATTPLFSILIAHFLAADERLSLNKLAGIALGIAGVAVLLSAHTSSGRDGAFWGVLACLGAAVSYGFANTFGRRFKRMGIAPAVGAFGQITATACMALPLVLLVDRPWQQGMPGLVTWGALIGLALLSTALAYIIFFRLIATAGATNTSLVTLLIPVSAVLLGAGFLGERLSALQFGGMALIGLGLIVLDGRLLDRSR